MSDLKRCPRCGQSFPLTAEYWHADKSRPTGLATYCKSCDQAKRRDRYGRNATDETRARRRELYRRNTTDETRARRRARYHARKGGRGE
jgi:hypothetical protein